MTCKGMNVGDVAGRRVAGRDVPCTVVHSGRNKLPRSRVGTTMVAAHLGIPTLVFKLRIESGVRAVLVPGFTWVFFLFCMMYDCQSSIHVHKLDILEKDSSG